MSITKHIPNSITMLNLFAGSIGVYAAFNGNYALVFYAVMVAGLFDFFDGLSARLLKAYSPMGKELDSLADVISFGLVPGAIVFSLIQQSNLPDLLKYFGFIIPVFSALRLAKFNIDESQITSFTGLPTPSNAIFWAGMGFAFSEWLIENPWIILVLTIVSGVLLVSHIPMFALKFSSVQWARNKIQYIFIMGCIVLILLLGFRAFAPIIVWYVLSSIFFYRDGDNPNSIKK